ncbi:TrmB family transcriptional regulator [Halobium salinum]|uniref:TrmB family transcriptional regulator n=1 Tax=Halobium salinum TaxID=1364940 RepID=A0ABD5P6T6_9EURY|nr:TrmB family transcriptional regulator [Halobium salinum]
MTGTDHEAVESLQRLGLSSYEAKVFLALQKLGSGTAREIHQLADVPRSQVYGAADDLEARGLVEIQQSTPKRYRPVDLDSARKRLGEEIEREREQAFEYLAEVRSEREGTETRDDVWTVRGREAISDRVATLVAEAERRVVFGTADPDLVTEELVATLESRADAGVDVTVLSENAEVRALFDGGPVEPVAVERPPPGPGARVLLVDDDTVLMSVVADAELPETSRETAIWSAGTPFGSVIGQFMEGGIRTILDF